MGLIKPDFNEVQISTDSLPYEDFEEKFEQLKNSVNKFLDEAFKKQSRYEIFFNSQEEKDEFFNSFEYEIETYGHHGDIHLSINAVEKIEDRYFVDGLTCDCECYQEPMTHINVTTEYSNLVTLAMFIQAVSEKIEIEYTYKFDDNTSSIRHFYLESSDTVEDILYPKEAPKEKALHLFTHNPVFDLDNGGKDYSNFIYVLTDHDKKKIVDVAVGHWDIKERKNDTDVVVKYKGNIIYEQHSPLKR